MDAEALRYELHDFPISLNMTCRILHKGKDKIRSLLGTRIGIVQTNNNQFGCSLSDVLELVGKNI